MGLMCEAIYVKLKLNEPPPPTDSAAGRCVDDGAAAAQAAEAAVKAAKAGQPGADEPSSRPKPKPSAGAPPAASEWISHIDSATDRPFWENAESGVVVWQNPHKKPKPPPLQQQGGLQMETPQQHALVMQGLQMVSHAASASIELSVTGMHKSLTINQRGAFKGSTHYHAVSRGGGGAGGGGSGGGGGDGDGGCGGGGGAPPWW